MGSVVEFYPWSKRGKYMMELDPSKYSSFFKSFVV